jgi:hypothetical protein
MALPDLSGSLIQNTYQRVLHTDGNSIFDGTGSTVLSSTNLSSLQTMNNNTISEGDWSFVETMDQHVHTEARATFAEITASAGITASGPLAIIGAATGAFDHIITTGDTIEFINKGTKAKEGRLKFSTTNGLQIQNHLKQPIKVEAAAIYGSGDLTIDGESNLNGMTAQTGQFIKEGSGHQIDLSGITGNITATGIMTLGTEDAEATHNVYGRLKVHGSEIELGNGHISASGDIKATGSLAAAGAAISGEITANTLRASEVLAKGEDGIISLGKVDQRVTAVIQGDIEIAGSDIKIGSGSIFASGNIEATGSSSSITAKNISAASVTATKILAKGEDGVISLGDIGSRVTAIVNGDIRIKGSDITIASGSISASGDIYSTGSLVAGGNVSAGHNGTGSFDHIVTTNNTIEFRDAADTSVIKGFLKYDDTFGIEAMGANKAMKLIQAHRLRNSRTIGGVSFNGTANINLPGVNTAGTQNTSGNAATSTKFAASKTIGGVAFDGSTNINLPGVNTAGNQNTTGTAAWSVNSKGYKGSNNKYLLSPKDFHIHRAINYYDSGHLRVADGQVYGADVILPVGSFVFKLTKSIIYTNTELPIKIYQCLFDGTGNPVLIQTATTNVPWTWGPASKNFVAEDMYLQIVIENDSGDPIVQYGGMISYLNK